MTMSRNHSGMALVAALLDCASQSALTATFRKLTGKTPGDELRPFAKPQLLCNGANPSGADADQFR